MNTYIPQTKKVRFLFANIEKPFMQSGLPLLLTALFLFSALAFPATVRLSVISSLNMCAFTLIPSLFPFMVAGELFFSLGAHKIIGKAVGKPFEKIFGISGAGAGAFLLGAVCGLPLGGKYALTLYKNGEITKDECQILMGLCNNAGMGFVVMGIGYTLWNSRAFGWLLYVCQIFAAIVTGFIFSKQYKDKKKSFCNAPATEKSEKKGFASVFTDSVGTSVINMLKLCGFVVFFGAVSAFLKQGCAAAHLPELFFVTLASFTEITFAAAEARSFFLSNPVLASASAKILTFFSVGFAGMSAHMQTAAFACKEGIRMKKYYTVKLICGIICALTGAIILHYFSF